MKYLCLVYFDERETLPEHEVEALWAEGEGYAVEPSDSPSRERKGVVSVTDLPVTGTKERLERFVLIDAPNLREALEAAARVPSAPFGGVEVRPVRAAARLAGSEGGFDCRHF